MRLAACCPLPYDGGPMSDERPALNELVDIYKLAAESRRAESEFSVKQRELGIREQELALKTKELILKDREQRYARWSNPVFLGLLAATVGLIGNLVVARKQNDSSLALQRI